VQHESTSDVLAAVDLTPLGRRVADRARLVAETLGIDLRLLHVIEPMSEAFISDDVADLLRRHRSVAAERMGDWIREKTDRRVTVVDVKGSPVWEIAKASKSAEITVVGTSTVDHGRVGPVASRVAESTRSHVLVVRRQPRVNYRNVVVACDLSEASTKAVELAMALAPDAKKTLFYALPTRFDAYMADAGMFPEEVDSARRHRIDLANEALTEFADQWEGISPLVGDGPPIETFDEIVRRRGADLLVVASRGGGATKLTLLGTVAAGLIEVAPCDVAIARVPGDFRRP
jgi:nucleotide-binding universal stress UspA family protein